MHRARQGRPLAPEDFADDPGPAHDRVEATNGVVAWLDGTGALVALGERRQEAFVVVRGFGTG
jgi:hypothetical protein